MPYITPITDRSQADIDARLDKAFWNVADWMRINSNTLYVRALLYVLRGINVSYTAPDEPTRVTKPTAAEFNTFLQNIENLRLASGIGTSGGLAEIKTNYTDHDNTGLIDYENVNEWERNLDLLKLYTISVSTYIVYCGVGNTGQERFWQSRFRNMFIRNAAHPVRRPVCGAEDAFCGAGITRQSGFRNYYSE
jgi:hypothetical protein